MTAATRKNNEDIKTNGHTPCFRLVMSGFEDHDDHDGDRNRQPVSGKNEAGRDRGSEDHRHKNLVKTIINIWPKSK